MIFEQLIEKTKGVFGIMEETNTMEDVDLYTMLNHVETTSLGLTYLLERIYYKDHLYGVYELIEEHQALLKGITDVEITLSAIREEKGLTSHLRVWLGDLLETKATRFAVVPSFYEFFHLELLDSKEPDVYKYYPNHRLEETFGPLIMREILYNREFTNIKGFFSAPRLVEEYRYWTLFEQRFQEAEEPLKRMAYDLFVNETHALRIFLNNGWLTEATLQLEVLHTHYSFLSVKPTETWEDSVARIMDVLLVEKTEILDEWLPFIVQSCNRVQGGGNASVWLRPILKQVTHPCLWELKDEALLSEWMTALEPSVNDVWRFLKKTNNPLLARWLLSNGYYDEDLFFKLNLESLNVALIENGLHLDGFLKKKDQLRKKEIEALARYPYYAFLIDHEIYTEEPTKEEKKEEETN